MGEVSVEESFTCSHSIRYIPPYSYHSGVNTCAPCQPKLTVRTGIVSVVFTVLFPEASTAPDTWEEINTFC